MIRITIRYDSFTSQIDIDGGLEEVRENVRESIRSGCGLIWTYPDGSLRAYNTGRACFMIVEELKEDDEGQDEER